MSCSFSLPHKISQVIFACSVDVLVSSHPSPTFSQLSSKTNQVPTYFSTFTCFLSHEPLKMWITTTPTRCSYEVWELHTLPLRPLAFKQVDNTVYSSKLFQVTCDIQWMRGGNRLLPVLIIWSILSSTSNSTSNFCCWIGLELPHPVSNCKSQRLAFQVSELEVSCNLSLGFKGSKLKILFPF